MGVINGSEYIKRINQLNSEVWIEGERVTGNISEHAAFKGIIKSQSRLYDLQHNEPLKKMMTYESTKSGERVGVSFLLPTTKEDLKQRRLMIQEWAKTNAGMMGRSPDYMNTVLVSLVASKRIFEENENCFPENVLSFYEKASENDWSFTHTFINPQVDRSPYHLFDGSEELIAAKIVDRNKEGIVIKGAKLLATQGGITDEIIVYSIAGIIDKSYSYSFSIPSNSPGLKFICRQPFGQSDSTYDSPLGARFEESDALVVFDHVLVPWDRVFYYDNIEVTDTLSLKGAFAKLALHQVVSRQVIKVEFILGVAQMMVDTINSGNYQHVQEKIAEIIVALETMKAFLIASEAGATKENGYMLPDLNPLYAAINTFPRLYPRLTEILQLLGASGLVSIPSERDFQSEIREDIDLYLQSTTKSAKERVKLFRLAWDTCMSAFGSRQTLYERYFFGDPIRLSSMLYQTYNRIDLMERVENQFLSEDY
ncbi:4-hydroxyphenylacetate 3-monooxygenase, oxygenase component [Alkalihalophilus lindianensis]|uniref:4-hydroxyphenylacetate 3-monooxygenase, oxygenase component n=1 Tax=Alkalihalophilus lindianensis TaxID=1630542 RepID=A0ABU3X4X3_9BACI|nr:4-hydroxyphenylacetate 3-monooxygenase, oxygenase component [Alkalihalophilus lindianensis]MDV2682945.1 4-hydroxyphenylacetate 3-monooxygenase, oxygenase component [Alkalihalophilus lindianensis]